MKVLVDMDGVLANFEKKFLENYMNTYPNEFSIPLDKRINHFSIIEAYPLHLREKVESIYTSKGFFESLEPIEGAIEAIQEMKALKIQVAFCTAPLSQYEHCVSEKYKWIEKHFGFDWTKRIIMTKDKTIVRGDYLIDDRPYIKGLFEPEWKHLLFEQTYNQHINHIEKVNWSNWKSVLRLS